MTPAPTHSSPLPCGARLLLLLCGMAMLALGGWAIIAYGEARVIVCIHSGPAEITCRETKSWLGRFPLGPENVMAAIQAAEQELSCHTDSSTDDYTCSYDTIRVFTPTASYVLFRSLPEDRAKATVARLNHFIQRDSTEEALIFEDFSLGQALFGLICVPVPLFIVGGLLFVVALLGRVPF